MRPSLLPPRHHYTWYPVTLSAHPFRPVAVRTCDDGSGGRGFESLPARFMNSAFQDRLRGQIPRFRLLA